MNPKKAALLNAIEEYMRELAAEVRDGIPNSAHFHGKIDVLKRLQDLHNLLYEKK